MAGTLYVVATPLGNLDDLSPRAAETLRGVAAVAAEDTRHTKTLLAHVGSRADLLSVHAHSPAAALRRVLHLLGSGKDVALVTDAGTPSVSDPGAELVAAARARDVPVVTVPGPTAVAAALSEGVPASVTSATSLPLPSRWSTRRSAAAGEWAWTLSRSAREPTCASRVFVWRVSSAATAATPRRVSAARGERSSRLPSGVATT